MLFNFIQKRNQETKKFLSFRLFERRHIEINIHLAIIYLSLENLKVMSTKEADAYEMMYLGL